MGKRLSEAKEMLKKIQYFDEYADPGTKYSQAICYYGELIKAYQKADDYEMSSIRELVQEANTLIERMKAKDKGRKEV